MIETSIPRASALARVLPGGPALDSPEVSLRGMLRGMGDVELAEMPENVVLVCTQHRSHQDQDVVGGFHELREGQRL